MSSETDTGTETERKPATRDHNEGSATSRKGETSVTLTGGRRKEMGKDEELRSLDYSDAVAHL